MTALTWAEIQQHCAGRVEPGCEDKMLDVLIMPPLATKTVEATVVPTRMHEPGFYVRSRTDVPLWANWMLRSDEDLAMFRRFVDQGRVYR